MRDRSNKRGQKWSLVEKTLKWGNRPFEQRGKSNKGEREWSFVEKALE